MLSGAMCKSSSAGPRLARRPALMSRRHKLPQLILNGAFIGHLSVVQGFRYSRRIASWVFQFRRSWTTAAGARQNYHSHSYLTVAVFPLELVGFSAWVWFLLPQS